MDYHEVLKDLRREAHGVRGRFQSIIHDNRFVSQYAQLPLVANERCGLWYVQPSQLADTAYFKSTDGHTGQWMFSLRRLNFHMLPLVAREGAVVLVDSTRKGKLMPDALLKTVPIWCAVLNYIMYEGEGDEHAELREQNWLATPAEMVSASEHESIAKVIPGHAQEVKKLGLTLKEDLVRRLGGVRKPLVPRWIYPGHEKVEPVDGYAIWCLTASTKSPNWTYPLPYVQGAADDHELWTTEICGGKLDAALFWNDIYYEPLEALRVVDMATGDIDRDLSEAEFVARINGIYEQAQKEGKAALDVSPLGETGLVIGCIASDITLSTLRQQIPDAAAVYVLSERYSVPESAIVQCHRIGASKKGAKQLRDALPRILQSVPETGSVVILCDTGKDICVGVALAILCKHYTASWTRTLAPPHVNKDVVKHHLSMVLDCRKVNPSRNTLQSVNATIMG